jgi:hypothetical protein
MAAAAAAAAAVTALVADALVADTTTPFSAPSAHTIIITSRCHHGAAATRDGPHRWSCERRLVAPPGWRSCSCPVCIAARHAVNQMLFRCAAACRGQLVLLPVVICECLCDRCCCCCCCLCLGQVPIPVWNSVDDDDTILIPDPVPVEGHQAVDQAVQDTEFVYSADYTCASLLRLRQTSPRHQLTAEAAYETICT